jgi:hypothetical protein
MRVVRYEPRWGRLREGFYVFDVAIGIASGLTFIYLSEICHQLIKD